MQKLDRNSDGYLDAPELDAAAGLRSSLPRLDADGDGRLDRTELLSRLQELAPMSDLLAPTVSVAVGGRPSPGVAVRLRPDAWQGDDLVAFEGTTSPQGVCALRQTGGSLRGLPKGFYAAEIATPNAGEPVVRGFELADDTNARSLRFAID